MVAEPSLAEAATTAGEMDAAAVAVASPSAEELSIARELVRPARARGATLTGPDGLLKALNKTVVETALDEKTTEHRRAVTVRGHFPTEQAALKCLYLVTRSLDAKGTGQTRWTMRWKPALNAFASTFAERMPTAESN